MKKNSIAHKGDMGICEIPSGYTTKISPGPTKRENNLQLKLIYSATL